MEQLGAKSQINATIKIDENMSHWITLCRVTIRLQMHTKVTHFNLTTH
jgi:hypothetical protein